jgi:hypothetical protein
MYAVLCDAGVGADENLHLQVPEFVAPAPDQITLLVRIFHERAAMTAYMAVLPGVLGCRSLRRTVQVRLKTNTLRLPGGPPASPERSRWRAGTPIFTVSRHQFMKHPG